MTDSTPHILSIDDEQVIIDLVKDYLNMMGYRVTGVNTPRAAMQVVENDPPNLIITDLQLPHSDGMELVSKLKKTLPDVPVILLTGVWFDEKTLEKTLSQHVSAYVAKTAPLQQLAAEVKKLLNRAI